MNFDLSKLHPVVIVLVVIIAATAFVAGNTLPAMLTTDISQRETLVANQLTELASTQVALAQVSSPEVQIITTTPISITPVVITSVPLVETREVPVTVEVPVTQVVERIITTTPQSDLATGSPPTSIDEELIPFTSPNNPDTLNPVFVWDRTQQSEYVLSSVPYEIMIIAAASGSASICHAVAGDFSAQVQVNINPGSQQGVNFGVWDPTSDAYLYVGRHQWSNRHKINSDGATSDATSIGYINQFDYYETSLYLKIDRQGSLFTLAHSTTGNRWEVVRDKFVFTVPSELDLCLVAWSSNASEGLVVESANFKLTPHDE